MTRWIATHARSLLFLVLALAVVGGVVAAHLPVSLFPAVSFPRIAIDVDAGDRPAELMALEVTAPVEESLRALPGVASLRSTTSRGTAEIALSFAWDQDMTAALLRTQAALSLAQPHLPAGTSFALRPMVPTMFPCLAFSLVSPKRTPAELQRLALTVLRPLLVTVPGVARVDVQGGAAPEIQVLADPVRLQANGLTVADVRAAIGGANVLAASGRVEEHGKLYLVMASSRLGDAAAVAAVPLRAGLGGMVRVGDVATVVPGTVPQWTRVTAAGRDAVVLQIEQQPGGNTVAIAKAVGERLAVARSSLPDDIKISTWYDQSELIVNAAASVRDSVLIGTALAALVLLAFLRSFSATLVAVLAVPVVLAITSVLLALCGQGFNIMTLGGMAAAVGLIIDDAIVMIEHIVRRIRDGSREQGPEPVISAAGEFLRPLAGSSAATVVIFAPLAFVSGVTGSFFKALSLTMASSLAISFLVAWLAVPLVARGMFGKGSTHTDDHGPIARLGEKAYAWLMRPLLKHAWLVVVPAVLLITAGWWASTRVGTGFMPHMDEGGFIFDYKADPGTALGETDRMLARVEAILATIPEVQTWSRRTGAQLGGGLTEANEGDIFVRLRPPPRRGIEAVMDEVRTKIKAEVPGLDIELALLMEDLIGDLTAVPQPIEIKLSGDDGAALTSTAKRVADALGELSGKGLVDVNDGIKPAGDALTVTIDPERAALHGLTPAAIADQLSDDLAGASATTIQRGAQLLDVRVVAPAHSRANATGIAALVLHAPDGHVLTLGTIATLAPESGQPQVVREDMQRMIAVTARISGTDLGSAVGEVQRVLARPGMVPPGVRATIGGLYQQQQLAFADLERVFAAAVALVFLLLLFLYESFRTASAVLLTTLLSLPPVFAGLWLSGIELNITAGMGMTMVVGIVTEVGIFICSEFAATPGEDGRTRLIAAGVHRMRPIAMTTLAAILALLPLALGLGEGSAMLQPLAVAIIAGLVVQPFLALVVLPQLLVLFRAVK